MRALLLAMLLLPGPAMARLEYPPRAYAPAASLAAALKAGARDHIRDDNRRVSVPAVFTGEVRPLTAESAEGLRAWIAARRDWRAEMVLRFVREFRFESAGQRFWLPVAEGGDFMRHMAPGESLELAVDIAGSHDRRVVASVKAIARAGDRQYTRTVNDDARNEVELAAEAARQGVERVIGCATRHALLHPALGIPASLDAMGPAGTGCLDAGLAAGKLDRYRLSFWPGVPDAAGRTHLLLACARPERDTLDGNETHAGDERGLATRHRGGFASPTCTQAATWEYDPLRHLKACLVVHADRERGTGYAANLLSFGPSGNGCLVLRADGARKLHDTLFESHDGLLYYEPDASVPRTRFQLRHKQRSSRHEVEYLTTETGSRHGALAEGRGVTRDDPEPEVFLERLHASDRSDLDRQAAWRPACEAGRYADCIELAHRRLLWGDFAEAWALWRKACEGGIAEGCLFDRTRLEAYRKVWSARCRERDEEACRVERSHNPTEVYYHALVLRRACEAGKRESCDALATAAAQLARELPILPVGRALNPTGIAPPR